MPARDDRLDWAALRAKLSTSTGREYWRSLQELAEAEGFQEFLAREFPRQASQWNDPVGRRKFLKLMGASLALAGLGACMRQPDEQIVPYVRQPEDLVLGKPLFFATAMTLEGMATGLLVESCEGRPTKVEGNPDHTASLGATDVFAQASLLSLYDPDRAQAVTLLGQISSWPAFLEAVRAPLEAQRGLKGAGLRVLTGTVTSPVAAGQLQELLSEMPAARWHQYEPAWGAGSYRGAFLAFGRPVNTLYRLDRAEVILSLDADFLTSGPGWLRYARDFSRRRRVAAGESEMNRLYVVESAPTGTGAKADHRLPLCPSQVEAFAWGVGEALGVTPGPETERAPGDLSGRWMDAVVGDLREHRGSSVVIAGNHQPPAVHALAHAINHALGNVGSTLVYTEPVEAAPVNQSESLRRLALDMDSGNVDILVILGVNPAYSAPADLDFARRMSKVRLRICLSPYHDETSELCHWHIPQAHYLEAWSDARAYDGTVSIVQPLIAPLYRGKSAHELLDALSGRPERSGYEIVREHWQGRMGVAGRSSGPGEPAAVAAPGPPADFERAWRRALHDGIVAGTALPPLPVSLKQDWAARLTRTPLRSPTP
ncbi:MAG: TAT-variant-translocated molybdopterin oxidoreductase, partial [Acidobacteria bacterium]|nr:TAT-variant-translocated molybdopterin oxidoreductase [Acidobacteriota bacterium]